MTNGPKPKKKSRSVADIKFCMLLALSGTEIIDPGITEGWGGGEEGRWGMQYKDCWKVYCDV